MAKRVFISFAKEDSTARDLLVGQARNENSPFEFFDMSVKEPWSTQWKTKCRNKIKGCDGVIALISKRTWNADGGKVGNELCQRRRYPATRCTHS